MPGNTNGEDLEVDAAAIAAEIGADLGYGENYDEGELAPDDTPPPQDNGETAPPAPGPTPGLTAAQARALPKAWKKEMEAHWGKLPPEVHEYVYEREANVQRGIQQYQQGYSSWQKLLEPYAPIFQANPNIDPVTVLQTVMNQHLQLARGTPEQKRALAQQLLQAYGVDMGGEQTPPPQVDPRVAQLEGRLRQMESLWQSAQAAMQQDTYQKNLQSVEAFSTDPKNAHWEEVVDDVYALLKTGAASTLPDAYELACLKNPAVRAKVIAAQAALLPNAVNPPQVKFPNINGASTGLVKGRKLTMDETIDAIAAKHSSTH